MSRGLSKLQTVQPWLGDGRRLGFPCVRFLAIEPGLPVSAGRAALHAINNRIVYGFSPADGAGRSTEWVRESDHLFLDAGQGFAAVAATTRVAPAHNGPIIFQGCKCMSCGEDVHDAIPQLLGNAAAVPAGTGLAPGDNGSILFEGSKGITC